MKRRLVLIGRWALVLPAFIGGLIVGSLGVSLLAMLQMWFVGFSETSGYALLYKWILSPIASGALGVYWAIRVAPDYRKIVATIALILVVILIVLLVLYGLGTKRYGMIELLVTGLATIAGAACVMYKVYEDQEFNLWD